MTKEQIKKQIEEGINTAIKYEFDSVQIDVGQYGEQSVIALDIISDLHLTIDPKVISITITNNV